MKFCVLGIVFVLLSGTQRACAMFDYEDAMALEDDLSFLASWPANGDLRLMGGNGFTESAGRLEVFLEGDYDGSGLQPEGQWGTVCGLKYRLKEANVACRQLGFQHALGWNYTIHTEFTMANSTTPVLLSGVRCRNKYKLHTLRCKHDDIRSTAECSHDQDVAVYCSSSRIWDKPYRGQVRLVNDYGVSSSFGKVEVYQGKQWGSVCGKNFGQPAADSVCRQIGYTNAAVIAGAPSNGSEVIWVEKINCNKSRSCFTSCFKAHKKTHQCTHQMDVAVQCMFDSTMAKSKASGSKSKCKIRGFPVVWLIVIICLGLSIVLIGGLTIVTCLVIGFFFRKKLKGRHYEELS